MNDTNIFTLKAAMDRYLREVSSKLSLQGQARDERLAAMLNKRLGGQQALESITPLTLSDYREKRLKEASAGTVEKDFLFLAALYDWAIRHWQLGLNGNPVNSLGRTALSHGRERRLRPGESVRLLAACDQHVNPLLGWIVRLGLETALRKSELLALREGDVNLQQRVVVVPKSQTKAPRPVPLTQVAVEIFKEVLSHRERPTDSDLLFYGELGRFGTRKPYAIDRVFRQLLLTARLKAFCFGDIRFEAISRLREAGCTELEIIAIAGTRTIRGRRRPEQQLPALLARLDALEIGLVSSKNQPRQRKQISSVSSQEEVEPEPKTRGKRGERGSFGISIGIRER
ncbi:MAG: site-specific integrase [Magnetococcales bacterium]|nr:site-specific integrase [Magnetococcales bacterium]